MAGDRQKLITEILSDHRRMWEPDVLTEGGPCLIDENAWPCDAVKLARLASEPETRATPEATADAALRSRIAALLSSSMDDGWNYAINAALDVFDGQRWDDVLDRAAIRAAETSALDVERLADAYNAYTWPPLPKDRTRPRDLAEFVLALLSEPRIPHGETE